MICQFNGGVDCEDRSACEVCGWNPTVTAQRLEEMGVEGKRVLKSRLREAVRRIAALEADLQTARNRANAILTELEFEKKQSEIWRKRASAAESEVRDRMQERFDGGDAVKFGKEQGWLK